jgi:hypothetical protein
MVTFLNAALPLTAIGAVVLLLAGLVHEIRRFATSRRANAVVGAMLLALLAIGTARFAWGTSPLGDSALLRKHSDLALPSWPIRLYYYDNAEHFVIAHMVLSPQQILQLPPGNQTSLEHAQSVTQLFQGPEIPEEIRAPQNDARLRHFCHCDPGWSSSAVLDSVHGDLWIVLLYTDMSGDEPGCQC